MKLENATVGTRVQVKDIDVPPTDCSEHTGRQYGLTEENFGTIVRSPDYDNDVKVRFEGFSHTSSGGRDYLYVNVDNLRKVK